jgi:uncharacterized protein (TIGR00725 family)
MMRRMTRRRQISVIGLGKCEQDSELARLAEEVGRGLADAGVVLVCGGMSGVMEAASRGAAEAGGTVIGISPAIRSTTPTHTAPMSSRPVSATLGT